MIDSYRKELARAVEEMKERGLYKKERILAGRQGAEIAVEGVGNVLNFCSNNYLGLSSHPDIIDAAKKALEDWGYGMSSVRFICGTQRVHKKLEEKVSRFLGMDDAVLYAACFDANGGVFEPFTDDQCAVITDALNHASIIDGIRLTKAKRCIYRHADMNDLEVKLRETASAKRRMIVTDGVFSMDGDYAPLKEICDLAERYDALVVVDDSHASGFIGPTGRGTHERAGVMGRVDLITTTFGKALGGAMGGCVSGHAELIEWLRQRSRPYLFSNSLAPAVAGASAAVIDLLSETTVLRDKLMDNAARFREEMTRSGFDIKPGDHPIVPIMLYDAKVASKMAEELLREGIYVIGYAYPIVPKGEARIRVQISAIHEKDQIERCIRAFQDVARRQGVLS